MSALTGLGLVYLVVALGILALLVNANRGELLRVALTDVRIPRVARDALEDELARRRGQMLLGALSGLSGPLL